VYIGMEIFIIFFSFRCFYSMITYTIATGVISKYTTELIDSWQYDKDFHYHNTMKISFYRYLFSFWLWGVIDVFKPEYKVLMKKYI
jgi:hypothetical protein